MIVSAAVWVVAGVLLLVICVRLAVLVARVVGARDEGDRMPRDRRRAARHADADTDFLSD